jgi:hypothetical protein
MPPTLLREPPQPKSLRVPPLRKVSIRIKIPKQDIQKVPDLMRIPQPCSIVPSKQINMSSGEQNNKRSS